jgi:hypothetical protein
VLYLCGDLHHTKVLWKAIFAHEAARTQICCMIQLSTSDVDKAGIFEGPCYDMIAFFMALLRCSSL